MKVTIQQEAFVGTIIQQQFEVEYVVASQQCAGMSGCDKPH
jgi:nonsense-mediated mRNA decay protein 3